MSKKFRMYPRRDRGGTFYWEDTQTREQGSLKTKDRKKAAELLHAKNQAATQPLMNREIGRTFLKASDPKLVTRTWQDAIDSYCSREMRDSSSERCRRAFEGKHFESIRNMVITETKPEDFLSLLSNAGTSTSHYLRRLHNYATGLGWSPWPVLYTKAWPKTSAKKKRAITQEEHGRIIKAESSRERRLFYELLWQTGGSQADVAELSSDCVDRGSQILMFQRKKLRTDAAPCVLRIGPTLAALLEELPKTGPLFPKLREIPSKLRASEFHRRCGLLKIRGISLHSYRYAWAERAKTAGMPERYAQECLGHASKAVHRAYARGATVAIPSIEGYEQNAARTKIIDFPAQGGESPSATLHEETVTLSVADLRKLMGGSSGLMESLGHRIPG